MLQLQDIRKAYESSSFTQVALDGVSLTLRDNEFAAILGPSGSGKTTLLNILGGLDHADSGDIVINGTSTRAYNDKDWDTYRNHRVGFIFQSYNLIPHQTVLANVELALTLAGISRAERRTRALAALERVGLSEHVNKRPNQLSGGQMQRVAIARALVNDPEIVLADEPTGALDTDTGIQVMELLGEIARDRLVVMVTHNPELAEQYATRIIRLRDGRIVDDTDPIGEDEVAAAPLPLSGVRSSDTTDHASMSFLTALALSFNNLMTKKGRTFMTAFAGSIGIIGIAAILALSNGVNGYIADTEERALSSYPLTVTKSSFNLSNLMLAGMSYADGGAREKTDGAISEHTIMADMFAQVKNNDLVSFREFLEGGDSGIEPYVNAIQYTYGVTPQIYKADTKDGVVRLNPSAMVQTLASGVYGSALSAGGSMASFNELIDDRAMLERQLEVVRGRWPERYDECIFVLDGQGGISDYTLYSLGVHDTKAMEKMTTQALNGEEVEVPETDGTFTLDDAMNLSFSVVPACELYRKNSEQGTWTDMTTDASYMRERIAEGIDLHVVGVMRPTSETTMVNEGIGYTTALTRRLMELAASSDIVAEQQQDHDVDVFTGKTFEELQKEGGADFDLESMFAVDEDALRQAFSFDTSALQGLGQGIDLSGMDLSSAMGSLDLSDLDLSGMDFDASSLGSAFDDKTLQEMMAGAPTPGADLLDGVDLTDGLSLGDVQGADVSDAAGKLVDGFVSWLGSSGKLEDLMQDATASLDVQALLESYLASDGAREVLASLTDSLTPEIGAEAAEAVAASLEDYMSGELAPYLESAIAGLDLAELDEAALRELLGGAPQPELDAVVTALAATKLSELTEQAATDLGADFAAWLMKNPSLLVGDGASPDYGALVSDYLKTDSAGKITSSLMTELTENLGSGVADKVSDAVSQAMESYVTADLAPYIAGQFSKLMEGLASDLAGQLAEQVGEKISAQMSAAMGEVGTMLSGELSEQIGSQMAGLSGALEGGFSVDTEAFANAIQFNMTQEDLASLLTNYMNAADLTYDANLAKLGYADLESPESISIYPVDFPAKESVLEIIDGYNTRMETAGRDDETIQYTDIAGTLMSSVTDIVNTISLVLIAFVSISLVVSSIMIAIITYVSVLERKKEIGILRAMGASKLNVANVFNAETVIEGLIAGLFAIAVVYAASVPVNKIVLELKDVPNIMQLPLSSALALVGVSVGLTLVAGLIPSSAAARRDPVEALRSE